MLSFIFYLELISKSSLQNFNIGGKIKSKFIYRERMDIILIYLYMSRLRVYIYILPTFNLK